ncbi:aromatic acid exporter family protein [Streptomyces sp. WMMC500]|uniref:FUSC family protein n=1 Tax=Streptomyces sp. WMMC500 TaxID=3015154 RepID=UPI00248B1F26|nr:FUSC family protein [Streptomyces sp. WMMC500]WBB61674.1 aromatic acid exporter family protein [Streptomyces sp. WMMC500]
MAATIAYVVALQLTSGPKPLTAPLTALLVVQVTFYATLTTGIRRVTAVVVGVLIASGFSALVGLSWWSLGLIILSSLIAGRIVRVSEFVPEVAISAMLVLGVSHVGDTAFTRILETLTGAVVGLTFNLVLAPPVWVESAGDAIEDLARRMRRLLLRSADQLTAVTSPAVAFDRLHAARDLDDFVGDVDTSLRRAEDSLRLNPRVSEGLMHRVVLRTGLDTLEICAVVVRVLTRGLADLATARRAEEPLFPRETGAALEDLLGYIGDALVSFAQLVSTEVSASAETAAGRLEADLAAAHAVRGRVEALLLDTAERDEENWFLYGALLADVKRILDELDTEHRSARLLEGLDRSGRDYREQIPRLSRLMDWLTR